jgi:hypothetical protein
MKNIIFVIILLAIGVTAYQKNAVSKREKIAGIWMMQSEIPGGSARMHVNLKPTGDFYIVVDAASMGRTAFGESAGKWEASATALTMNFTQYGIPGVDLSRRYGGQILKLDDTTLTYRSKDGWKPGSGCGEAAAVNW